MSSIDSRAAQKLQPELLSGETIYWAGTPNPGIIFHSDDLAAIPFALLWTGFWVFWEASALGIWSNNASSAHSLGNPIPFDWSIHSLGTFLCRRLAQAPHDVVDVIDIGEHGNGIADLVAAPGACRFTAPSNDRIFRAKPKSSGPGSLP